MQGAISIGRSVARNGLSGLNLDKYLRYLHYKGESSVFDLIGVESREVQGDKCIKGNGTYTITFHADLVGLDFTYDQDNVSQSATLGAAAWTIPSGKYIRNIVFENGSSYSCMEGADVTLYDYVNDIDATLSSTSARTVYPVLPTVQNLQNAYGFQKVGSVYITNSAQANSVKYNLNVSGNKFDFAPYRSEDLGENLIVDYDSYKNFEYSGSAPGDEVTITKIAEKHYRITDDLGAYDWRDKFFGWDLTGKYVNGKIYKVGAWMRGDVNQTVYIRDLYSDSGRTIDIANISTVWKYFEFVWTYSTVISPNISFGRSGWHLALTNQWFEVKNPFVQEVIDSEISETNFLASMIYNKNACTGNGFGFPEIWNSSILALEYFNPANGYEWDLAELTQANIDNYLNPAYQGRVIVKRYSDTNIKFLITAA